MKFIRSISVLLIIAGTVVLLSPSCKVIDPAEEIPAYIQINAVTLSTSGNEGSASHRITDVWIYIDGALIGAFELPCRVPVLNEGNHSIMVRAGVKQNGMSSLRAIYPFYKAWESSVQLTRGVPVEVSPAFTYVPGTDFIWMEDFESVGTALDDVSHNYFPGLLTVDNSTNAFESNSGHIVLTETESMCRIQSADSFYLDPSHEMYLEMNYKCDQPIIMGLSYHNGVAPIHLEWMEISPSAEWNKIYIRLNDALIGQLLNRTYHVYFRMSKPGQVSEAHFWLDNLKWIN